MNGLTVSGDNFQLGTSLQVDANSLIFSGHELQVGTGFHVSATDLSLTGKDFTLNDGADNQFRVTKDGILTAREVHVNLDPIPDYVFEPDYDLMSIEELKAYIQAHGHLPSIKSAAEYEEIGYIDLTELNLKLLEKMEEMSLYTIAQEDRLKALEAELEALRKGLEGMKAAE